MPGSETESRPPCLFCERPNGSIEHIWPDWICRDFVDDQDNWLYIRQQGESPLQWIEEAGREVDVTTDLVCHTCNQNWLRRLEDKVSQFLKPTFVGAEILISEERRKTLAKWAVGRAVMFECDNPDSPKTPKVVCERIREVNGVPPGYEVFLARYLGPRILEQRRFTLNQTGTNAPDADHVSLSHLLVGEMLVYVFADPWTKYQRAVSDLTANHLLPLVGGAGDDFTWPPSTAVNEGMLLWLADPRRWVQLPPHC